jgi:hypothetical protein
MICVPLSGGVVDVVLTVSRDIVAGAVVPFYSGDDVISATNVANNWDVIHACSD